MVYPVITDNFELDILNANFLELYNQLNVSSSETPTASYLGAIVVHTVMKKSVLGRYKLRASCGVWSAGTQYTICTLSTAFRPTTTFAKHIILSQAGSAMYCAELVINDAGLVQIKPLVSMNNNFIQIDEIYTL